MMSEKKEEKKPHISVSALTQYERCGVQYEFKITIGPVPPGFAMARGSGVHGGIKVNFRQKQESHEDMPKSDIVDASVAAYEYVLAGKMGVAPTPEEKSRGYDIVAGEVKDTVVGLAELYADELAPQYQPALVEQRQRVVTTGEYDLVVYLDMVDEFNRIRDFKTTGKAMGQGDLDDSEQLTFYSLAYKALTGTLPKDVGLDVLVETPKAKKRYVQQFVGKRTDDDLAMIVNRINRMIKGLKAGIFIPALAGSWQCSPRWCGYWERCKFRSRG
jgi:hypothetical protein